MDDTDEPTWHWVWHVYVVAMVAVAVAVVFQLDEGLAGRSPWGATAAMVTMVAWLTIAGRRVPRMGPPSWRSITYVVVAVALWTVALWCSLGAFAAMPALYPMIFSTIPMVPAIATSLLITLFPLGFDVAGSGVHSPHFPLSVAMTVIGLIVAPVIGIVIIGAVRQRIRLAGLVRELSDSRAETSRLSREAGVAAERERLAREIHDTLAQGFTSIVALTQAVEAELATDAVAAARHVSLIEATARENLAEARTMVTKLTPSALDGETLSAAIARQCRAFSEETGIEIDARVAADTPPRDMATDVVLLRVAQEALTNVRRHADATRVRLTLDGDDGFVRLSVSDNGVGLTADHTDGFGLRGVRTRVAQAGGSVSIAPAPGGGTTIAVAVPV